MQTEDKIDNTSASASQEEPSDSDTASKSLKLSITFFAFLGIFWSAFVFLWLWRWFIVPLGVQNITFWHSLGLVTVGQFLLLSVYPWNEKQWSENEYSKPNWAYLNRRQWRGNLMEAYCLFVGWLAHFGVRHIQ